MGRVFYCPKTDRYRDYVFRRRRRAHRGPTDTLVELSSERGREAETRRRVENSLEGRKQRDAFTIFHYFGTGQSFGLPAITDIAFWPENKRDGKGWAGCTGWLVESKESR